MRVLILLALLGTALAVPKTVTRIVGGQETSVENYPYMANMQYHLWNIWWMQFCGGSLLTSTIVLSAAHCFVGDIPSQWHVILGTSYASGSGGSTHRVADIVPHEHYNNPTLNNDIAIIRLAQPATYSTHVRSARIAGIGYVLSDGTPVTAIGWGALSSGSDIYPDRLRDVEINIINQELCVERYAYLKSQPNFEDWPDVTEGMLCAGILDVGGKDSCQGDSGGPLAHDGDVIVGVTSWGFRCGDPVYPGVSARVSYYADWIVRNSQ